MRQVPLSPLSFDPQRVANVPEHPPPSTRLRSCAHIANRRLSRIIGARYTSKTPGSEEIILPHSSRLHLFPLQGLPGWTPSTARFSLFCSRMPPIRWPRSAAWWACPRRHVGSVSNGWKPMGSFSGGSRWSIRTRSGLVSPSSSRSRPATIRSNGRSDGVLPHGRRCRLHAARGRARHCGLRFVLQAADRGGAAQERHLALRHGEDQGDNGAADSMRALRLRANPVDRAGCRSGTAKGPTRKWLERPARLDASAFIVG